MSKIVLIRPMSDTDSYSSPILRIPLALLYVGSVLRRNGHEVKIIDVRAERNCNDMMIKECEDALIIGITALTSEVKWGLEVSQFLKDRFEIPIVWGGIHPSLYPRMTCEDSLVDYAVFGEGEYTMLELVEALESHKSVEGIKGLVHNDNGMVKVNEPRDCINLDELPPIDYELIDMGRYLENGIWRKAMDAQTSRGCPYHCRFCVQSALDNHKVRLLSASKVVDNCEWLVEMYGVNYITFIDDNFFINKKRAEEICRGLIERRLNLKWFAEVRADFFRNGFVDKEFLELAQESGLTNLTIGAESGVPEMLKLMDKGITVDDIVNTAKVLTETDIVTAYSFIIGLPSESKDDILTTLKFLDNLYKIYPRALYKITTLRAYPGSELTEGFIKDGWIKEPKNLREFADHEINKVYTESPSKPVWHSDPEFAYSIACYSNIAHNPFTGVALKANLKYSAILLLPATILQKIARFRLRHQFFRYPIDTYINKLLMNIYYSRIARSIVRWKTAK